MPLQFTRFLNKSLIIFLIFFLSYISITSGTFWERDSQAVYEVTSSFVDNQKLNIGCYYESPSYNGQCYSKYGLFTSISTIPFYLIEKFSFGVLHINIFPKGFFSSLTNALTTSLLVVLIYKFLINLKLQKYSFVGTLLIGYCTVLPAFTKTLFSEPLFTLLIYSSIYKLTFFSNKKSALFWAGLFFGLAFLTKVATVFFIPVFILLVFYKKIPLKNMTLFALPAIFCLLIFLSYNYLRFNTIFDTGYRDEGFTNSAFYGLYLFIISPGKSFFLYQPFILLSFLGMKAFFKEKRELFISLLILTIINFAVYSTYRAPVGDIAWGSRYLYTSLPFFVISIIYFLKYNKSSFLRFSFFILLTLSLIIQLSSVYLSNHRYYSLMGNKIGIGYTSYLYNQPELSPLIGQWKLIFKLNWDDPLYREAFQEYPEISLNNRLAPADLFFIRSKIGLLFLSLVFITEAYLIRLFFKHR